MKLQPSYHRHSSVLFLIVALLLAGMALPGQSAPLKGDYVTANGITIRAGLPLPVFKFLAPTVSAGGASDLSQLFDGIYARQGVLEDSYLGNSRFTVPNTTTLTLLQQYGATGGYYAFRTTELISDTARGAVDTTRAQELTCQFLRQNNFIAANGALLINQEPQAEVSTPNIQGCDYNFGANPPYQATPIVAAVEPVGVSTQATTQTVGVQVTVPINLNTGRYSQTPFVPLGGPGGHISLLFRTTNDQDEGFSLDRGTTPGLVAVAMPFYSRTLQHVRNVPTRDPAEAAAAVEQQVRDAFPDATDVTVPPAELLYMVDDAAEEQGGLEPMLNFEGITVEVDGETIVLRDIATPALQSGAGTEGFGPAVVISAPANNSTFNPANPVNLAGTIGEGSKPYLYQWFRDDGTPLSGELSLAEPGIVTVQTNLIPTISREGLPQATTVILRVTDNEGAQRAASVSLLPEVAPALYLPLTRNQAQVGLAQLQSVAAPAAAVPAAINYYFGIESGSDYPPYGPGGSDLPGVPPDANGFRSGMLGYGWAQRFYWSNAAAWEKDWRDCSLGGIDCTFGVDRVDFAYYAGHGGPGGLSMPSNKDSTWAAAENARFQQVRWVGFSSCQTLRAEPNTAAAPIRRWFNSFRGSHMLLGFNSNMADVAFGPRLMENLRILTFFGIEFPWAQLTIREAWVITAFNMNAGKPAYIYAVGTNGVNPVNNKLPRATDGLLSRPFPVASYHWVWWWD